MKLNAASEPLPVSWPEFAALHPFAPADQAKGYGHLVRDLRRLSPHRLCRRFASAQCRLPG